MTDVITNTSHLWYMNKKCIVGTLPLGLAGSGTKNFSASLT